MVGPVPVGINKFVLQAPAPEHTKIPITDLIGVTVVLVTCSFMDHEFVRIGYYVNNEYSEHYEEGTLPNPFEINKLTRNILAAEPRVTRFAIDWTGGNAPVQMEGEEGGEVDETDALDLDEMENGEEDDEGSEDNDEEDNDDDIDLEAEDEGEGENATALDISAGSPNGMVMMQEDSNSMDVAMMQKTTTTGNF